MNLNFKVMRTRNWIILLFFIILSIYIIWYTIYGRIPISAKGNALFLTPETVKPFQTEINGKIKRWYIKVGDVVQIGSHLATIEQPLKQKELEQNKKKLQELQEKNVSILGFTKKYIELEQKSIQDRRKVLKDRIKYVEQQIKQRKETLEGIKAHKIPYLEQHKKQLQMLLDLNEQRKTELLNTLARIEKMRKDELCTQDQLLNARQSIIDQDNRIANLKRQIYQEEINIQDAQQSYLTSLDQIVEEENSRNDLQLELAELEQQQLQHEEQLKTVQFSMESEENTLKDTISRLEKELEKSEVYSKYAGCILELPTAEGDMVTTGQRIGTIDTKTDQDILKAVAYFTVADGKKIHPGMTIRLNPASADRIRFGSLLAKVNTVSRFPISTELVAKVVGNSKLAQDLTKDGHQIEVIADLLQENNHYVWDQNNSDMASISAGTMAKALINLEEKLPIEFIIPNILLNSKTSQNKKEQD